MLIRESSSLIEGADIARKLLYLLLTKLLEVLTDFDLFLPGLDEQADKFDSFAIWLFTGEVLLLLLLLGVFEFELMLVFKLFNSFF